MSSILPKMSLHAKDQLISKKNCQAVNSSKKRTNEFIFTTMRRVFACFLEEIEDTKETFRNHLTSTLSSFRQWSSSNTYCTEDYRLNQFSN